MVERKCTNLESVITHPGLVYGCIRKCCNAQNNIILFCFMCSFHPFCVQFLPVNPQKRGELGTISVEISVHIAHFATQSLSLNILMRI